MKFYPRGLTSWGAHINRLSAVILSFWFLHFLFNITQPSSFSLEPLSMQLIGVAAVTFWSLILGICFQLFAQVLCFPTVMIPTRFRNTVEQVADTITAIPISIMSMIMTLIMLDNFTYTLFRWRAAQASGLYAWFYILAMLTIAVWYFMAFRHITLFWMQRWVSIILLIVLTTTGAVAVVDFRTKPPAIGLPADGNALASLQRKPNILIISIDGVRASNTTTYNRMKPTTPFLQYLSLNMDVFFDHYPSSCCTAGSLTSMWTGKFVTHHKVAYPPSMLPMKSSFEHLPGILKTAQYSTHQIGPNFYGDAFQIGLRHGFDTVNFLSLSESLWRFNPYRLVSRGMSENSLFTVQALVTRVQLIVKNLLGVTHILTPLRVFLHTISSMFVSQAQVAIVIAKHDQDYETLQKLKRLIIKEASNPWFIHVHLMDTHGDGSDKGLLKADKNLEMFFNQQKELFEQSLIIITSDHNEGWKTDEPVPFMIHYPKQNDQHVFHNVLSSSVDIAPTILDYLGLTEPQWMDGVSLRSPKNIAVDRFVITADGVMVICNERRECYNKSPDGPPFGIQGASLRICNRRIKMTFDINAKVTETIESGNREGAEEWQKCLKTLDVSRVNLKETLFKHLMANGVLIPAPHF